MSAKLIIQLPPDWSSYMAEIFAARIAAECPDEVIVKLETTTGRDVETVTVER